VTSSRPASAAESARGLLPRIEEALLALLLGGMILLAALQIGLRSLLGTGLPWADPLLRVLVLWVGLLGAVTASREGRHITVDVVSRMLPARARAAAGVVTGLFTAGVAAALAWHGARFVASERQFGSMAFSGIPAWGLESVIPGAFALIAVRYLRRAARDLGTALRGDGAEGGSGAESGSR
jgi:TRAP-type C4-dicarboxylate transport system permease small subunit